MFKLQKSSVFDHFSVIGLMKNGSIREVSRVAMGNGVAASALRICCTAPAISCVQLADLDIFPIQSQIIETRYNPDTVRSMAITE